MKRRTFLKILGIIPAVAMIPQIVAKEKSETITISGASNPVYNGDFTIIAKDKFSKPMLDQWSKMVGIRRAPAETDEQLRIRILGKMERR